MRIASFTLVVLLIATAAGCSGREEELQRLSDDLEQQVSNLSQNLATRDQYIADMVSAVNAVYSGLEVARKEEASLFKRVSAAEADELVRNPDVRQQVIQRVSELGSTIETNKKKVTGLQRQLASANKRYTGLEEMVEGLKKNVEEREQSIAALKETINQLTGQMEEKNREIADRESRLTAQQVSMNTAYYIVGTRDELEQKGVIQDEGGFPWGLFGSTTIIASGVDERLFTPVDMTATRQFQVEGEVDEIVPKRNENFYQVEDGEDMPTVVRVTDGKRFWQDRFLVIIKD